MNHLTWRKSNFSITTQNCVELAEAGTAVLMRDSKHPGGGHLSFSPTQLRALIEGAKAGAADHLI